MKRRPEAPFLLAMPRTHRASQSAKTVGFAALYPPYKGQVAIQYRSQNTRSDRRQTS